MIKHYDLAYIINSLELSLLFFLSFFLSFFTLQILVKFNFLPAFYWYKYNSPLNSAPAPLQLNVDEKKHMSH
jgi:hypothetical protein